MALRLRNIPIRMTIGTVFALLFTVTVLAIVIYSYRANSHSLLKVSGDLLEQHTALAVERTVNYLNPASVVSDFSTRVYGQSIAGIEDHGQLQAYCVEVLRKYPQFAIFNYGNERGNIYGAERGEQGKTIVFQTTRPTPETKTATYQKTFFNASGKQLKVEREPTTFDPRVRPWYRGAVKADGRFWTGVYVLVTDRKQIAISVSYPLKDRQGKLRGVVGGDLGIREISGFLRRMKVGRRGFVLLLDEKNRVIAHPEFSKAFVKSGGKLRLKHLRELGHAWVTRAVERHGRTGERRIVVEHDGERQIVAIQPFPKSFGRSWKIVLTVPEDDFVGVIKETNRVSLMLSVGVLLLAVLLITTIASRISRPIVALTAEANRIRELDLEGEITIRSSMKEIDQIYTAVGRMKAGMRAFLKYVPASLVRQLVDSGAEVELGGEQKELTLFFSDIKGFTSVSEAMAPEQLMTHLSEYLDELTGVLMKNRGTVDKYIGDAIMAFWGAPLPCSDHAYLACRSALRCQQALDRLNEKWVATNRPALPTRIGLNTGLCVVGNVGSSDRMNYTVLGDSVNLASRLEGVNKVYGTSVILSEATHKRVADRVLARTLDLVIVKGRTEPTRILELVALVEDDPDPELRDQVDRYEQAFAHHLNAQWAEAIALLEPLQKEVGPKDPVVDRLLKQCQLLLAQPPTDDNWCCTHLSSK